MFCSDRQRDFISYLMSFQVTPFDQAPWDLVLRRVEFHSIPSTTEISDSSFFEDFATTNLFITSCASDSTAWGAWPTPNRHYLTYFLSKIYHFWDQELIVRCKNALYTKYPWAEAPKLNLCSQIEQPYMNAIYGITYICGGKYGDPWTKDISVLVYKRSRFEAHNMVTFWSSNLLQLKIWSHFEAQNPDHVLKLKIWSRFEAQIRVMFWSPKYGHVLKLKFGSCCEAQT